MFASSGDIVKAGRRRHSVTITGVENQVEIVGLTFGEAQLFSEIVQKHAKDPGYLYAWLVKKCCPAFRWWWWPASRIKRRLSQSVVSELAREIMKFSRVGDDALEDAAKN